MLLNSYKFLNNGEEKGKSYESLVLLNLNAKLFSTAYLVATKDSTNVAQNNVYYTNKLIKSQGQFVN